MKTIRFITQILIVLLFVFTGPRVLANTAGPGSSNLLQTGASVSISHTPVTFEVEPVTGENIPVSGGTSGPVDPNDTGETVPVAGTTGISNMPIEPTFTPLAFCEVAGCSGELCVDSTREPVNTICLWKPEYACYKYSLCTRQPDGRCGWTQTPQTISCLAGGNPTPVLDPPSLCGNNRCDPGEAEHDAYCPPCNDPSNICPLAPCTIAVGTCPSDCKPAAVTPTPTPVLRPTRFPKPTIWPVCNIRCLDGQMAIRGPICSCVPKPVSKPWKPFLPWINRVPFLSGLMKL